MELVAAGSSEMRNQHNDRADFALAVNANEACFAQEDLLIDLARQILLLWSVMRALVRTETRIMEALFAGADSGRKDCRYRLRCVRLPLVPLLALVALQQRGDQILCSSVGRGVSLSSQPYMYSDRPDGGHSPIDGSD